MLGSCSVFCVATRPRIRLAGSLAIVLSLALVCISAMTPAQAQAGLIGSQSFADIGSPSVNTGNINTATEFTFGLLITTGSQEGAFVGMANQFLGSYTFNDTVGTSLTFGNSVFGFFSSTTIDEIVNSPSSVVFSVAGNYTPGTYVGGSGPDPATMTISFNQSGPAISDNSTLAVNTPTPEPSSLILALVAVAGAAVFSLCRRRSSGKAAA
jgi:hypothetical protein